ncbi:hypothetical protein BDP81DRAFT_489212 [Colletotrichum phormii]|uniref:Uncharacterized protein n=1 Tax=Colletotrichum phormii TaxID=359342 RepID=A0AAJ0EDN6_9PEZI|nr:uncharacterized protein BDP81DRAFT_489212 [Colletotrichum phormii]KAK1636112.1 hypothetical protein BDP81DRAFT_489212 [Colletotrichum phormii]
MRFSASVFTAVALASVAMALPTDVQTVDLAERDFVVETRDLSGPSSKVAPNTELAVRQLPPSKRKNLFTITLKGGNVIFNGDIKFILETVVDTTSKVTTFHLNPLVGGSPGSTASMRSYELKKNFFESTINRVSAEVSFTYRTASGVIYNFLANVVYGIDSRLSLKLEDVQLFDIEKATQQIAGKAATNLFLGSYDDDYKDL